MPLSRQRLRLMAAAFTVCATAIPLAVFAGSASALPEDALPGDPQLSDYSAPESDEDVTVTPIDFEVSNQLEPGSSYTLRGFLYEPAGQEGCRTSVVQANHALTTGAWYWDIPFEQDRYSIARKIVKESGVSFLALNKLGYGQPDHPYRASDRPNGYTVTVEALADASHQVTQQLRADGYEHVGLIGHSAGSEESELQAGLYQDVDALILSGFTHLATERFTAQIATQEVPRTLTDDYPFFFGDHETRDSFLFTDLADPELVRALHPLVNETPAGEILSIGPQPSRAVAPLIDVPVLTLIAEADEIFNAAGAPIDEATFLSSDDVTFNSYPGIGHGVEFHRNGPEITQDVADWISERPEALPACGTK
ncbi:alpha/beta hydrolase [Pseudonocardia abyssalis]|uniref:Alpha/beta hydrolase n=2 Tax=Pseudonocardia abyssalis TaxID=2792008 RepID=A0ABS6UVQ4_9PSEU|nr:alpha/beta hydrolase [Pseudonocardia abyssalis]